MSIHSFASWLPKPDLRAVWPYRKKMATSDPLKYHSFFKINFKSCFYLKSLHTDSPLRNWNLRPGLRFGSKPSDPPPWPRSSLPGAARQSLTTWTTQNTVSWGVRNSQTPCLEGEARGPAAPWLLMMTSPALPTQHCHLSSDSTKISSLQLLIFHKPWKEFGLEVRNKDLCPQEKLVEQAFR